MRRSIEISHNTQRSVLTTLFSPPERLANPRRAPRPRDRQPSIGDRADGRDPPWRNDQAQASQAFPSSGPESVRDPSLRLRCKVSRVVSRGVLAGLERWTTDSRAAPFAF